MFYRETHFKETPIGKIPKDWELEKLGNVCIKITDGTHKTPEYVNKGIPFLSTRNIIPFRKGFDFSKYEKYISKGEHKELIRRCKPGKGDILVSKCGTIGRTKFIDVNYEFSIFVGVALLKLKKDAVSGEYLEQLLNYEPVRFRMEISSPGSTRKTLTINAIKKLGIPLPPLEEQKKIAAILSTVDYSIQKTDAVIGKTEMLKRGLMQRLLTHGIGHHRFKKWRTWEVPVDRDIVKLGDIIKFIRSGISREFSSNDVGYAVIRSTNIQNDRLDLSDLKYWHLIDPKGTNLKDYVLDNGDLLVNFINSLGQIGKCCIFWAPDRDCIYTTNIFRVRLNENLLTHNYFNYFAQTFMYKKQIFSITKPAVQQASFTQEDFKRIEIPAPPILEQQRICKILSNVDQKLERDRNSKGKLEHVKKGLMSYLLTGKVRVKVN